jgi:hypothetical protein
LACGHGAGWSDSWLTVVTESGAEEILAHPVESSDLEALGLTWAEAQREGRLKRRLPLICDTCGTDFVYDADDPRLIPKWRRIADRIGFALLLGLPALAAGLLFAMPIPMPTKLGWLIPSLLAGAILAFLVEGVVSGALQRSASTTDRISCHVCEGELLTLFDVQERTLACPTCKKATYVIEAVGKS